jgi:hypothetical protein
LTPFDELFPEAEKLHHAPGCTIETKDLLTFPIWPQAKFLQRAAYSTPEDYVAIIRDGLYCPQNNVVATSSRKIVAETVDKKALNGTPAFDRERGHIAGKATLLRSPGRAYYHVIVDRLPRLLALERLPYSEFGEIQLLCPGGPSRLESFLLSRIPPKNFRVVTPTPDCLYSVEEFIFTPFKTRRLAGYIPEPYLTQFRTLILPDRPSRRNRRILISRENQSHRKISNNDELSSALKSLGFELVIPEELSMEEEIELFYDAEAVVGAHGSGITNIAFSDQTAVLELFPTWYMVPSFYFLSKALGHQYGFLCGSGDERYPESSPVDVPAVIAKLREMSIN